MSNSSTAWASRAAFVKAKEGGGSKSEIKERYNQIKASSNDSSTVVEDESTKAIAKAIDYRNQFVGMNINEAKEKSKGRYNFSYDSTGKVTGVYSKDGATLAGSGIHAAEAVKTYNDPSSGFYNPKAYGIAEQKQENRVQNAQKEYEKLQKYKTVSPNEYKREYVGDKVVFKTIANPDKGIPGDTVVAVYNAYGVEERAGMILIDPNASVRKNDWAGITYHDSTLGQNVTIDGINNTTNEYYLQTKGKEEQNSNITDISPDTLANMKTAPKTVELNVLSKDQNIPQSQMQITNATERKLEFNQDGSYREVIVDNSKPLAGQEAFEKALTKQSKIGYMDPNSNMTLNDVYTIGETVSESISNSNSVVHGKQGTIIKEVRGPTITKDFLSGAVGSIVGMAGLVAGVEAAVSASKSEKSLDPLGYFGATVGLGVMIGASKVLAMPFEAASGTLSAKQLGENVAFVAAPSIIKGASKLSPYKVNIPTDVKVVTESPKLVNEVVSGKTEAAPKMQWLNENTVKITPEEVVTGKTVNMVDNLKEMINGKEIKIETNSYETVSKNIKEISQTRLIEKGIAEHATEQPPLGEIKIKMPNTYEIADVNKALEVEMNLKEVGVETAPKVNAVKSIVPEVPNGNTITIQVASKVVEVPKIKAASEINIEVPEGLISKPGTPYEGWASKEIKGYKNTMRSNTGEARTLSKTVQKQMGFDALSKSQLKYLNEHPEFVHEIAKMTKAERGNYRGNWDKLVKDLEGKQVFGQFDTINNDNHFSYGIKPDELNAAMLYGVNGLEQVGHILGTDPALAQIVKSMTKGKSVAKTTKGFNGNVKDSYINNNFKINGYDPFGQNNAFGNSAGFIPKNLDYNMVFNKAQGSVMNVGKAFAGIGGDILGALPELPKIDIPTKISTGSVMKATMLPSIGTNSGNLVSDILQNPTKVQEKQITGLGDIYKNIPGFDVGSLLKTESLEATKSLTDLKYDFKNPTPSDGGIGTGSPDININIPDIGSDIISLKEFGGDVITPKGKAVPELKLDLDLDVTKIVNSKLSKNFWKKNRDWV